MTRNIEQSTNVTCISHLDASVIFGAKTQRLSVKYDLDSSGTNSFLVA